MHLVSTVLQAELLTFAEPSCLFLLVVLPRSAGAGINVTGKGIASSVAPGPGLPGMVHLIDKAGGSGNITGCQGQATWLFDYTGESKEASFSGKMQQVNGKLSVSQRGQAFTVCWC